MLVRKKVFEELSGFDEKFFVSFEDVDLGWRAWIMGYRVVMVPKSIVYHFGGQTIERIKPEVAFHGFKNQLSMKITNFETGLAIKNMIKFFIIYGFRELRIWFDYTLRGRTSLSSTKYEFNLAPKPSFRIILKSIGWILRNQQYLSKKRKAVNSMRVFSTHDLQNRSIICNKRQ